MPEKASKAGSIVVAGTTFDLDSRYELIKAIGHGAYGVVISCTDTLTGNKVAVKKIQTRSTTSSTRNASFGK